jgi:hypothetical protein
MKRTLNLLIDVAIRSLFIFNILFEQKTLYLFK